MLGNIFDDLPLTKIVNELLVIAGKLFVLVRILINAFHPEIQNV